MLISLILQNAVAIGIDELQQVMSKSWLELQARNSDINNFPALAHDLNHGLVSSIQLNFANVAQREEVQVITPDNPHPMLPPNAAEDNSDNAQDNDESDGKKRKRLHKGKMVLNTLQKALGTAGGNHIDRNDNPQGLTIMFSISNIHQCSNVKPGLFFFPETGMAVEIIMYRCIVFCGLNCHGGSPPCMKHGFLVEEWMMRAVVVLYLNFQVASGQSPQVIALSGYRSYIELTPAHRFLSNFGTESSLNAFRDLQGFLSKDASQTYATRAMAMVLESMAKNCPTVDIDTDLLQSLFIDPDTKEPLPYIRNWDYRPGMSAEIHQSAMEHFEEMAAARQNAIRSMPSQMAKKKPRTFDNTAPTLATGKGKGKANYVDDSDEIIIDNSPCM